MAVPELVCGSENWPLDVEVIEGGRKKKKRNFYQYLDISTITNIVILFVPSWEFLRSKVL
jgi:hypothetical protein